MDTLRFQTPEALLLLLLLPALALYLRRRNTPAVSVGSISMAENPPRTWRIRSQPLLSGLRLVAVAMLVLSLARPQRGEAVARTQGNGIDIVLAFDISSSMSLPFARGNSRLSAAKEVLTRFVQARTNDRVGMVVFQGSALTLAPLTSDYHALEQDIEQVDNIHLQDGTAIGVAIGESATLLRGSTAATRIVILLTDGENNSLQLEPLAAARIAEKLGIRVYTVGVVSRSGNPGGRTLNVDEESLRAIANVTHGTYNRAEDPAALQAIYEEIDRLERSSFEDRTFTRFDDVAPYLLAAAAAAIAAEMLLRRSLLRGVA